MGDTPLPDLVVRTVTSPDELAHCVKIYEKVFRLGPGDGSLNTRLLVGLVRNSGIVIGAFTGDEMVGFALSFLAFDQRRAVMYQYSQLAVVVESAQGHGIGRLLKKSQRDAALAMGVREMHWAFDPFIVRNAHFNLNILGARAVSLERNLYGSHGHGLDVENSTDRLRVIWDLTDTTSHDVTPAIGGEPGRVSIAGDVASIVVPLVSARRPESAERDLRRRVLEGFDEVFAQGLVAVSCDRFDDDCAVYTFQSFDTP